MNRKLFENIASLYGAQIFGYLIPLLTLPYLARCLGTNQWGRIAFAEAYAANLSILIEYGFGLSASREIARSRNNLSSASRQVSDVLGAQLLLTLSTVLLSAAAGALLPSSLPSGSTLVLAVVIATGRSFTPIWFFQGLENLRLVALISVSANSIAAAAIFGLVRSRHDAWKVLAIRGISSWAVALIAVALMFRSVKFIVPSLTACWQTLKNGSGIFIFKSAVSFYTTANVLLLGVLASPVVVAWFAGAEKISKVAIALSGPISQAFYPRIANLAGEDSRDASREFLLSARLMISLGVIIGLVLFVAAPLIIRLLLGVSFERSVPVLRILSFLPLLVATSNLLGIQWMLPLRLERDFNFIIISAGLVNVCLAFILVPRWHELGMATSVLVSETLVPVTMLIVLSARSRLPWTQSARHRKLAA